MKFLIVEDEPSIRTLTVSILARHGTVEQADNGPEALAMIARANANAAPFEVILLDIMMPGLDGLAVLEAARRLEDACGLNGGRRTAVIILTGLKDSATILKAFRNQADGYLTKPFKPKELVDTVLKQGHRVQEKRAQAASADPG